MAHDHKLTKEIAIAKARLEKVTLIVSIEDELKAVAPSMSKTKYLDPRVTTIMTLSKTRSAH